MFFEYELRRHHQTLEKNLDTKDISALIDHALVDLKKRSIAGIIIVPLAFIVGGFATDYATEQPSLFLFLGIILGLATICRILVMVAFSRDVVKHRHFWVPLFFWANIFIAVVWGCFTSTSVIFYHDSISITLIFILLAGLSGGSVATYCIWKLLSYSYLIIILAPSIIAEFYIGNRITISIGVAVAFFLSFNLFQANVWNREFWYSLINTFRIEKHSTQLATLNRKLNDEILDHKQTARAIETSKKQLQDIYNSAHDGIYILELNGLVIDINDTILSMFQVGRKEALQFDIKKSFKSSANKNIDLKNIWKAVLDGQDQEFPWHTILFDRKGISTIQVNLRRTIWGDHHVIIATIRDITPQIEALNSTIAANRAKSNFMANMSHELRTPLHGILGYARLGIKRSDTIPRVKLVEYFSIIHESGTRLMRLVNNVLDFSKMDVGEMRYTMKNHDLLPKISQQLDELKLVAAEKDLQLKVECSEGCCLVYCDQEKIAQVISNLLFNAIKFSTPKTHIRIICEAVNDASDISQQKITVANRGIAIPEDEIESIFEKFKQSSKTDTGAGGTGLGLAISKQIISDHGGTIGAENAPNGETLFQFVLTRRKDNLGACQT